MIAPPTTIAIAIAIAIATATAIAIAIAIVIGMAPAPCAVRRDRDCGATPYHLRAGSRVSAGMRRRGEADGPTNQNRSRWFPLQTRPRRTQCGVGADESFVTNVERGRTRIPVAPLPVADHGAHLAGASSRFLLLTSLCGGKEK